MSVSCARLAGRESDGESKPTRSDEPELLVAVLLSRLVKRLDEWGDFFAPELDFVD